MTIHRIGGVEHVSNIPRDLGKNRMGGRPDGASHSYVELALAGKLWLLASFDSASFCKVLFGNFLTRLLVLEKRLLLTLCHSCQKSLAR